MPIKDQIEIEEKYLFTKKALPHLKAAIAELGFQSVGKFEIHDTYIPAQKQLLKLITKSKQKANPSCKCSHSSPEGKENVRVRKLIHQRKTSYELTFKTSLKAGASDTQTIKEAANLDEGKRSTVKKEHEEIISAKAAQLILAYAELYKQVKGSDTKVFAIHKRRICFKGTIGKHQATISLDYMRLGEFSGHRMEVEICASPRANKEKLKTLVRKLATKVISSVHKTCPEAEFKIDPMSYRQMGEQHAKNQRQKEKQNLLPANSGGKSNEQIQSNSKNRLQKSEE